MVCCGDSWSKLGVNRRRKFGTLKRSWPSQRPWFQISKSRKWTYRGSTTINHPYLFSNRVSAACLGMIHDRKSGVDPTFLWPILATHRGSIIGIPSGVLKHGNGKSPHSGFLGQIVELNRDFPLPRLIRRGYHVSFWIGKPIGERLVKFFSIVLMIHRRITSFVFANVRLAMTTHPSGKLT